MTKSRTLKHQDAHIHLSRLDDPNRWKISVEPIRDDLYIHQRTCNTSYPIDLIQKILEIVGPGFLIDEILRDQSPNYVSSFLRYDLLAYVDEKAFENKTLLDFGCGQGASTMVLRRLFPQTKIIGVELEKRLLDVAQARACFYGYNHLELIASPGPHELPEETNEVDFVVLSGVYEHLLPEERTRLMPKLWSIIKPGGILFLNQTPHRGFPIEMHTTGGLPLINYLPDAVAHRYARTVSKRNLDSFTWESLLRMGIRGGTINAILRQLGGGASRPVLLQPSRLGLKDRIDLWYIKYKTIGNSQLVRCFHSGAKVLKLLTGVQFLPNLSLAIQKPSFPEGERVDR